MQVENTMRIFLTIILAAGSISYASEFDEMFLAIERGDVPLVSLTRAPNGAFRDYQAPLSNADRQDIRYIVTSLANNSMVTILFNRNTIERAGDRIEPVHPLQFLYCVFTDEEMKAGIHNIRGRSLIWKDFYAGIRDSLQAESEENNMNQFIPDFARRIGLNPSLVHSAIVERRWHDLFDILFTKIPRSPERNRYDD